MGVKLFGDQFVRECFLRHSSLAWYYPLGPIGVHRQTQVGLTSRITSKPSPSVDSDKNLTSLEVDSSLTLPVIQHVSAYAPQWKPVGSTIHDLNFIGSILTDCYTK